MVTAIAAAVMTGVAIQARKLTLIEFDQILIICWLFGTFCRIGWYFWFARRVNTQDGVKNRGGYFMNVFAGAELAIQLVGIFLLWGLN